ncbi:MAG: pilus assembly protein PilM [Fuerstiella sp.]
MSITAVLSGKRRTRLSRRKTGWIGVDIGAGAIKIAQVERTAGRCRIARSVILRAPDGGTFDPARIEDGSVAGEIRGALSLHGGFVGKSAACVVSMSECELRTLISARGTEDEQRELISLELQQDLTHTTVPREFDFWDSAAEDQDVSRGMTQVHVMSVPRSLADGIGTALLDAGLRCELLDTVPFCALRAMEIDGTSISPATEIPSTQAILDWGYSAATLIVLRNGQPMLARCLRNCGTAELFSRVAERLKLTRLQTDTLLMNYGIAPPQNHSDQITELGEVISELAGPLLHDLTEELMQTFDFLNLQFSDQQSQQLVVAGGGGAIPGSTDQLGRMLQIPVRAWQLPLRATDPDQPEPLLANAAALSALAWE